MKTILVAALTTLITLITCAAWAQPENITIPADSPAQRTVQLEELWRVGGDDEEDILLGMVATGVLDDQGNMYLLDTQLSQVLVIDPAGQLTATLGNEGQGPGELSRPTGIFLNNQQQIGITKTFPGKIILLNIDGTPGGTITINQDSANGGYVFLGGLLKQGDNLVVLNGRAVFDTESGMINTLTRLSKIDEQGRETARFAEHADERNMLKQDYDEEANFSELTTWTVSPQFVFTTPERDQYIINVKNMDGELVRVISRPFQPRKRKSKDKDELKSSLTKLTRGTGIEMKIKILDHDQAILKMNVAADGRLFVQNCYQAAKHWPAGTAKKFDIIDDDGNFLEELTIELPGFDDQQDALVFIDGKHFLYLKGFEGAANNLRATLMGNSGTNEEIEDIEPLKIILCRILENQTR